MLKQNHMSMTMSVLRSWFFPGLVQLALGSVLLAAEQAPEPWAAKPLGPKIAPAPFVPAPNRFAVPDPGCSAASHAGGTLEHPDMKVL
jgi:hypothetical protein